MTPEQLDEIEKLAGAATPGPWLDDVGVEIEKPEFYGDWYAEWYACAPGHTSKHFDSDGEPTLDTKEQQQAWADARFIVVMRRCALPLVKALREARERDEGYFKSMEAYRLEVEDCCRRMSDLLDQCAKEQADAHQFQKERDQYQAWMLAANDELAKVRKVLSEANELRVELTKERNEARAEVEWLKAERDEARAIIGHYERKDGPTFQAHLAEAKALKERDDARAVADQCKDTIAVLREQAVELRASHDTVRETAANFEKAWGAAVEALGEARAEVERLREAVRQVHALASGSIAHSVSLRAIHNITKGMVE